MAHEPDRRTTVARLAVGAADAQRVAGGLADLLAESLDAAVAAYETSEGWAVELHFVAEPDEAAVRALLARIAGAAAARALAFEPMPAKDWVAASLADLAPVAAGRFIVHGAHDRTRVAANKLGIEIEAGLAFGTGHHGTTRACLLALDAIVKQRRPRRILDLGTGSGVLAIAAAKALRAPVLASDTDPQALRIARANASQNGVAPLVEYVHAPGLTARRFATMAPFDLVLANILLNPLMRMASPLAPLLAPHARVVLSGLLRWQGRAALAAYRAQGLVLERRIALEEWVTLVLRRA
jgi:ribosomal protein L11 methyltransferase